MSKLFLAAAVGWTVGAGSLFAVTISVPNASFELPVVPYAAPAIDSWQKSPKPDWYVEGGGFTWEQLTGTFKNTATNSPDHIDNCDGSQALWLFALPEVALFQDESSTAAFAAKFEVGKAYQLTVGVIGGGGGMAPEVTLELSLYYRDAASNRVTVAATAITNSLDRFPTNTHFIDFTVSVPTVQAGDAWAGQNLGIRLLSTVSTNLEGGYWDLDNVQLSSFMTPVLLSPVWTNGQFSCLLQSEPGRAFEMLASTNPALPVVNWINLGTLTNATGTIPFIDTFANFDQRFYRARQLP